MRKYYISFNAEIVIHAETPQDAINLAKCRIGFVEGVGNMLVGTPVELGELE